jgi:hypothetical protein
MNSQGSCFGYEASASFPLELVRQGSGIPLKIDTHDTHNEDGPMPNEHLIVEWKPRPNHPFHGRVYEDDEGLYRVWTSDAGWFFVDRARRLISAPVEGDAIQREVRLWSTPTMLLLIGEGKLMLHSSAVEINGKAVLFGGPSRFGKTTLAAAFHTRGYRVLAEDTTCVTLDAEQPQVLPGPALLRVRHDVADRLHLEKGRMLGADEQRVFFVPNERGTSEPLPVHGLYLLGGSNQGIQIEKPDRPLLPDVWALAFRIPTDQDLQRCFAALVDLVDLVPIWDLHRPHGFELLDETMDAIVRVAT